MTLAALKASRKTWRSRLGYRSKQHAKWVKKEAAAKTAAGKARAHEHRKKWTKLIGEAERLVSRRDAQIRAKLKASAAKGDKRFGGSRYYTNRAIKIVGSRAPVTSRKRWALFGNPGSDHYMGNTRADAVDFGIANAFSLADEVSRELGGPSDHQDFGTWTTSRNGRTYVHQLIAGTHGTGPHLHYGVHRA